jgi:hypothetical protein
MRRGFRFAEHFLLRCDVSMHHLPGGLPPAPDSEEPPRMTGKLMPDWMVTPAHGLGPTFERVAINQGALCVECMVCGRRSALNRQNCAQIRPGNKTPVSSVTFRCQNRSCGSNGVRLYNAHTEQEAVMWVAGDALPPNREVG